MTSSLVRTGWQALPAAFAKIDPRHLWRSPVILVVWVGSALTTFLSVLEPTVFSVSVTIWLWATVLFANLAEAVAEGRGKAQAETLRRTRTETTARRLLADGSEEDVRGTELLLGDLVVVEAGQVIPGDGDVVEGVATVDESAITGESAPVVRESGGDRCAVTGGTTVLSDRIVVRVTSRPGETFIDRMIALVEGASRQKTPNEVALSILLTTLTIIFVLAVSAVQPMAVYSGGRLSLVVLVALLVCLIPTTIGALLSAIGIAGMDRLVQRNVLAMSGRAVEAAGDVSTLLLDKTGTITFGNRRASAFVAVGGTDRAELAAMAHLSSLADETPEGRSVVEFAREEEGVADGGDVVTLGRSGATFVPFSATTRMSGVDLPDGSRVRKGAADAVLGWTRAEGGEVPGDPTIRRTLRINLRARGYKVEALDEGADDYVTKPFGMDELMARIRSAMRRGTGEADTLAGVAPVVTEAFTVDFATLDATRGGEPVHLTPTEWRLLAELARHRGTVVTQADLLRAVWGPGYGRESNYLRVYSNQLRRKLEADPARPVHIVTEPGIGYRLL